MIATIRGTVTRVHLNRAIVDVGGVGYLVFATPATLAKLREGAQATLATSLVVREDSFTLYGFDDDDEREVFETVQTVSGIGPRLALAVLAVHTPDALRRAIADEDLTALVRVPGIGKKGAQRMVLELGTKLGAPSGASQTPVPRTTSDQRDQVVAALVGLGWNAKAAQDAVDAVVADRGEETVAAPDVALVLRAALRSLGGSHG